MEPRKPTARKAKKAQKSSTPYSLAGQVGDAPSPLKPPKLQKRQQSAGNTPTGGPVASSANGQEGIQEPGAWLKNLSQKARQSMKR